MTKNSKSSSFVLGFFILLGLSALGYLLSNAAIQIKEYERTITVKGLSESEYEANIIIWPIQFTQADNDLENLYAAIEASASQIRIFLESRGITPGEITVSIPSITDKSAQQWANNTDADFRYTAIQNVTVYSKNVGSIRNVMSSLSELGKKGIVFSGDNHQSKTEYIFTKLNDIKPEMIQEATKKAREVAEKFAQDSHSKLGKIKRASQGQFSIRPRDTNNPHIKKIRVVSTVEYYLSD